MLPKDIYNQLVYKHLVLRLYGDKGQYRYIDENHDFYVTWNQGHVEMNPVPDIDIEWILVQ